MPDTESSTTDAVELGSDAWLAAQTDSGRAYHGEPYLIEVVVSGDRSGAAITYHVALEDGLPPQFRSGKAPGPASATLELSRTEAEAQRRGRHPVVSYMQGSAKTKGATRPLYELFRLLG